jgi:hypothetical protein
MMTMTIQLSAKTLKGKNIIRRYGKTWRIIMDDKDVVGCKASQDEWRDDQTLPDSFRWIRKADDKDFVIKELKTD